MLGAARWGFAGGALALMIAALGAGLDAGPASRPASLTGYTLCVPGNPNSRGQRLLAQRRNLRLARQAEARRLAAEMAP